MKKEETTAADARPWIGVRFVCAGAYRRVVRDAGGMSYTARCPRCSAPTVFRVGPGGATQRFFEVTCQGRWPSPGE